MINIKKCLICFLICISFTVTGCSSGTQVTEQTSNPAAQTEEQTDNTSEQITEQTSKAAAQAEEGSSTTADASKKSSDSGGQGEYADKYIELHLHLDGAITVDIAKKLAELQNIELPEDEVLEAALTVPEDCTSLTDFLACFETPGLLLQTKEAISEAVYLVAENIKSQNVIYAEIRFAPQLHLKNSLSQEEVVLAALEGLEKTDLKANLILCCMRGEGNSEANFETVELAKKYLVEDGGVVGIDLAGDEANYPTSDYEDIFAKAKEYNIPFTIHAGEAAGPESIENAVEFGATRIGHGVRLYEDEELEKEIKEKGIFLEMCPTSNKQTKAVEDMSEYPLIKYLDEGIKVTLNSDDMAIEGITLADEFRYMEETFGLTPEQEKILLENSVEAAFTSETVKEELRNELGLS